MIHLNILCGNMALNMDYTQNAENLLRQLKKIIADQQDALNSKSARITYLESEVEKLTKVKAELLKKIQELDKHG